MDIEQIIWAVVGVVSGVVGVSIVLWLWAIRRMERRDQVPRSVLPDRPYDHERETWDHVDLRNPNAVILAIEEIVAGERTAWLDRVEMIKDLIRAYREFNGPSRREVSRYRPDGAYGW